MAVIVFIDLCSIAAPALYFDACSPLQAHHENAYRGLLEYGQPGEYL